MHCMTTAAGKSFKIKRFILKAFQQQIHLEENMSDFQIPDNKGIKCLSLAVLN